MGDKELSLLEIKNLMLETLAYESDDIDSEGNMGPNLPNFHVTDYGLRCLEER